VHERTKKRLLAGDFIVQETPKNLENLESYVKLGFIQMEDWDLHYKLLGEEPEYNETEEEIIIEEEIIETDASPKNSQAAKDAKARVMAEASEKKWKEEAEKAKKIAESLSVLTCVKIRRDEIFAGLVEKGITSIEKLANTNKDILLSIKYVGETAATDMLEEAKGLSGGSKEE